MSKNGFSPFFDRRYFLEGYTLFFCGRRCFEKDIHWIFAVGVALRRLYIVFFR